MTSFSKPKPRHRLVMCRGEFCNMDHRADRLLQRLRAAVDDANAGRDIPCASIRTATCLSMCGAGPNLIVYPEDDVHNKIDADKLEAIIARYLQSEPDSAD